MQALFMLEASKPDGTVYRMRFSLGIAPISWLVRCLSP